MCIRDSNRSLLPLLKANGLTVVEQHENLNEEQAAYVDAYFDDNVYPVLTLSLIHI